MFSDIDVIPFYIFYSGGKLPEAIFLEQKILKKFKRETKIPLMHEPSDMDTKRNLLIISSGGIGSDDNRKFSFFRSDNGVLYFIPQKLSTDILKDYRAIVRRNKTFYTSYQVPDEEVVTVQFKLEEAPFEEFCMNHKIKNFIICFKERINESYIFFKSIDINILIGIARIPLHNFDVSLFRRGVEIINMLKKINFKYIILPEITNTGNLFIYYFPVDISGSFSELTSYHILALAELYSIKSKQVFIGLWNKLHEIMAFLKNTGENLIKYHLPENTRGRVINILDLSRVLIEALPLNASIPMTVYQGSWDCMNTIVKDEKVLVLNWDNFDFPFPPFFDLYDYLFYEYILRDSEPPITSSINSYLNEVFSLKSSAVLRKIFNEWMEYVELSFVLHTLYMTKGVLITTIRKGYKSEAGLIRLLFAMERLLEHSVKEVFRIKPESS